MAPGDARLQALGSLSPNPLSPNGPGLLLSVADGEGAKASEEAVHSLLALAPKAGFHTGLRFALRQVPVPTNARAAEAVSADTLYPGLGPVLTAAKGADLFVLDVPAFEGDWHAPSFILKKVAAEIRGLAPAAKIAVVLGDLSPGEKLPASAKQLLSEENLAYVDLVGMRLKGDVPPDDVRAAVDEVAFGRPGLVDAGEAARPADLLDLAARYAPAGVPAVVAAGGFPPDGDASLLRLGGILSGDWGNDMRATTARAADGSSLRVRRFVSGLDLGGVVMIPGLTDSGQPSASSLTLTLDAPTYAAVRIVELGTGRSKDVQIPRTAEPTRLSLSTAKGPLALVLTARERAPAEATRASVGVSEKRGLTADEIIARHQAWRAEQDLRWHRFEAIDFTSIRFRFQSIDDTVDLALKGPFFFEPGKGYDWAWNEAYVNGVRWRGKKIPELPLIQPEKVTEVPLALTFNDAYSYELAGEETVDGIPCFTLRFRPRPGTVSLKPLYDGFVWIAKGDYAVVRTKTRQVNLKAEVLSVDETSDYTEVPAPDGGAPLRLLTHTLSETVLKTFSATTLLERETRLSDIRVDPPGFEEEKKAAYASQSVMLRDTDEGLRYLKRTKEGDRVVTQDSKTSRLFGLAGLFYDGSYDYPLPLAGVSYIDLNFRNKQQQIAILFGGVLLAASFNEPRVFGSAFDFGVDVFGVAVRGTDQIYQGGTEIKSQGVGQRSVLGRMTIGHPVTRHLKVSFSAATTRYDYARSSDTDPAFVPPSDTTVNRLEGQAVADAFGISMTGRFSWNRRSEWEPWGYPGNPDYSPGKREFRLWSVQAAKDFHLSNFRRIRTQITYLGSNNTDRFSKYTFGFFEPTSLIGFKSLALRAQEAATARVAYGYVVGETLRLEAIYQHAWISDSADGLSWANFGGVGFSGEFPGPWSTLMRLDVGTPVVGRERGQNGVVISLYVLKIF